MKKPLYIVLAAGLALPSCVGAPDDPANAGASAVSEDVSITAMLTGTVLSVRTSDMPKGWFTRGPGPDVFDPTKSPITLTLTAPATACSPSFSVTLRTADGTLNALLNPAGRPNGYYWTVSYDLGALADHWHNHVACDGSVTVEGCPDARTVTATLNVGGACSPAAHVCTATATAEVPSVQDADVVDTACSTSCEIGACVSACARTCGPRNAGCHQCCECRCKAEGLAAGNVACRPQDLCYTGSPGHLACLAP
ncbi:MAG: hypothetical protein U0324_33055 [Polyangiales bacterium]